MSNIVKKEDIESAIGDRFLELTDEQTFKKEVSFAVQAFSKNPQLMKCDKNTVLQAVLNVAQTGLTLNPVNPLGYLVPSYNSKTKKSECHFRPSYQGLAKLITDTGSAKHIFSEVVYEGDEIEFDFATDEKVTKHIPYYLNGKEKGNIIAVYSKATLFDGSKHVEACPSQEIYDNVRKRSESWKYYEKTKKGSCVWVTDEAEMFRKAIIRKHTKYLPKTDNNERLLKAIELDNSDYTLDADSGKVRYALSLVNTSIFDEDQKQSFESELNGYLTEHRCNEIMTELQDNQLNAIQSGRNYSQTDIKDELK